MATDAAWTVAELTAALSRLDATSRVTVFARTGRGDAISTDRFELRVEQDDDAAPVVTFAAGWDRGSPVD